MAHVSKSLKEMDNGVRDCLTFFMIETSRRSFVYILENIFYHYEERKLAYFEFGFFLV